MWLTCRFPVITGLIINNYRRHFLLNPALTMAMQVDDCVIYQAVSLFTQVVTDDASETVPLDIIGCAQAATELR